MSDQQKENLKIISKPLKTVFDGQAVGLKAGTDKGELVFFQIDGKEGNNVIARGVVSLQTNIEQLKQVVETIEDAIKEHEAKKAKK